MKARTTHLVQLHASLLLLGLVPILAKWIDANSVDIIFARCVLAAPVLAIFMLLTKQQFTLPDRRTRILLIIPGLLLGAHWATYFYAIKLSSVATAVLALYTFPVLTVLLEPIFFRTSFSAKNLLLAGWITAGIVALVNGLPESDEHLAGLGWGLFSALLFVLRNLLTRRLLADTSSSRLMLYQLLVAAASLSFFLEDVPALLVYPNPLLVAVLAILGTAVAHTLWIRSMTILTASTVGLLSCLGPLYSIVSAALLLGEIPGPFTWIGGFIVISGAVMTTASQARPDSVRPPDR